MCEVYFSLNLSTTKFSEVMKVAFNMRIKNLGTPFFFKFDLRLVSGTLIYIGYL